MNVKQKTRAIDVKQIGKSGMGSIFDCLLLHRLKDLTAFKLIDLPWEVTYNTISMCETIKEEKQQDTDN